jgi:hypothetical protein
MEEVEEEEEIVFVHKIQRHCSDYQKVPGSVCFVIVTSLARGPPGGT